MEDCKILTLQEQILGLDFHPTKNILAAGLITGAVQLWSFPVEDTLEGTVQWGSNVHAESCRSVAFSKTGEFLYSASKDQSISFLDAETGTAVHQAQQAHSHPINCLYIINENQFASGDDEGTVKLWDAREKSNTHELKHHKDYISDMLIYEQEPTTLLSTGGDGRLSVIDTRKGKKLGLSEEIDDELLSLQVLKNGKKVVCGSQEGDLMIFSWGYWNGWSDKFPGHPQSIDSLLKVDEETILSGSSDGILRMVNILPNKLMGIFGDHEGYPVETMKFSHDKKVIGSICHDEKIRMWNSAIIFDDDDDDDDGKNDQDNDGGGVGGNGSQAKKGAVDDNDQVAKKADAAAKQSCDEDEEEKKQEELDDDDGATKMKEEGGKRKKVSSIIAKNKKKKVNKKREDGNDGDSSSEEEEEEEDDSDDESGGKGSGSKKKIKTKNELFFADL
mmetsp:Transcript_45393/g.71016  ORF Transcript_45393/g.71016 Transcript_45393/m.71016 type:complete len:446 (-) Transcript_45393:80-1417(-)